MGKELPKNWVLPKLKQIVKYQKGKKPKILSEVEFEGSVPYLDIRAFEKDEIRRYADKESSTLIEKDEIGIVWDGARSGWVSKNKKGAVGSTIAILKPQIVSSELLYRFLESKFDYLNTNTRGIGIPHVDPTVLWDLDFPLPPLPEQTRIVAKLDQLFGQLEQINESLDKIPQLLKDFRQQVLTQAVTGKLTEEWREGRNLDKWSPSLLGKCCKITMGQSPPGSTYNDIGEGVPLINGPVEFGGIDPFSKTKKVKFTTKPTKFCELNDLLICVRGSTTGRINISGFRACIGRGVAAIKAEKVLQDYVNVFMRLQYAKILSMGTGSTFPSISGDFLKKYEISIPPQLEQQEIIKRVESLFVKADAIEQQYQTLKQKIDNLPQAILHKAFKGELVPQLESDGDARELLEEIEGLRKQSLKPKGKKSKTYKVEDEMLGRVAEDSVNYKKE
ncbi:restriction endonuclease subunit S [Aequorivita sp. CIP111184]|uniref:restriction endonuclease subunit S n=1 Tax=Aequorivita sp. CIP111184 TaxID=2211356 RepID=UPI000DBBBFE0|nr:restriction endonuclease subunit S [Aequorivita sp. CIP111184]SRX56126.1 Type-1 restriction enzyme EcoKI specificity protein [Aequorivita sp. CIP111184]